jgi:hypothetical protein
MGNICSKKNKCNDALILLKLDKKQSKHAIKVCEVCTEKSKRKEAIDILKKDCLSAIEKLKEHQNLMNDKIAKDIVSNCPPNLQADEDVILFQYTKHRTEATKVLHTECAKKFSGFEKMRNNDAFIVFQNACPKVRELEKYHLKINKILENLRNECEKIIKLWKRDDKKKSVTFAKKIADCKTFEWIFHEDEKLIINQANDMTETYEASCQQTIKNFNDSRTYQNAKNIEVFCNNLSKYSTAISNSKLYIACIDQMEQCNFMIDRSSAGVQKKNEQILQTCNTYSELAADYAEDVWKDVQKIKATLKEECDKAMKNFDDSRTLEKAKVVQTICEPQKKWNKSAHINIWEVRQFLKNNTYVHYQKPNIIRLYTEPFEYSTVSTDNNEYYEDATYTSYNEKLNKNRVTTSESILGLFFLLFIIGSFIYRIHIYNERKTFQNHSNQKIISGK